MPALRNMFQLGLLIGLGIEIPGSTTTAQTDVSDGSTIPSTGISKADRRRRETSQATGRADRQRHERRSLGRGDREGGGTARPAHAGPGAEALRDCERGVASQDIAPVGPDAGEGSSLHTRSANAMNGQAELWRPGEVRARPSRCTRSAGDQSAACSPTTTPTPPQATTTWRPTSTPRGSTLQAQPLYEKALEIRRRLLTDDHPDTANSYNNLAYNLNAQGKYAQAQPLYEKALEISRRLLTDDHPDTAISYDNLAGNLDAQGKYAQAQPLFEKALEIHRRLLTDDHPHTASSYNNLAVNLNAQGKYAQAQPLYEKALEIRRRLLTDDHPDTANSYNNLAANLNAQGKYAQAQPLYEKALEIHRRLLTDDHPDTANSYNNLASNLNAQGKYAAGPAAVREGAGDPPPPAHRRPPRHRRQLQQPGGQPQRPGEVRPGPAAVREGAGDPPPPAHRRPPRHRPQLQQPGGNLDAQGKYLEARDRWLSAVKSLDAARLRVAFTGLERAGRRRSTRPPWPPCWPGSVSRPRPGRRWRKTWAEACSTSWPPARTGGSHPPSEPDSAN